MKTYTIKRQQRICERFESMLIIDRETGELRAEYPLTPGKERAEIVSWRRTLDAHLASGGALGNYQF